VDNRRVGIGEGWAGIDGAGGDPTGRLSSASYYLHFSKTQLQDGDAIALAATEAAAELFIQLEKQSLVDTSPFKVSKNDTDASR